MKTARPRDMYWVILTFCVAMLPQLLSMPAQLMPIIVLPIAWRLAAERWAWRPIPMPLRVLITIITVLALVATHGGLMGRRAAIGLLTLMLSLKLLETFKVRDARIVASLSLFLGATQFLFTQGIPMAFYAVSITVCAMVALALLHRREAFMPVGAVPATGASIFAELGFSARLLGLAIPVALVVFLFFPRWSSPLWGVPEAALDAKTGLSDRMSPGTIQSLFMDDSPAFRVDFQGTVPPRQALYWRGPVFWIFDGITWSSSYYGRNIRAPERPDADTAPWRYRVQMEPTEQHWIFALDYPALVPDRTRLTLDYQLFSPRSITRLRTYEMASDPEFMDSPNLRRTLRQAALELPADFNPRTRALIDEWRRETPDDRLLITRILRHFNREAFRYSLNPPLLGEHTVDEFMFGTRSGFCEHYASAFTVMMRMAGIPARVVTGYQGGWFNELGGYVLVRQSDAHAWSEVWLPGSGWTRIDPTAAVAPDRVESGALEALGVPRYMMDFAWLRRMKNGFDLVQRGWNDWVIAFSADRQLNMLRPLGLGDLSAFKLVLAMVMGAVLVSLLLLPLVLRLRHAARRDPARRLWLEFQGRLARAGVVTRASHGPMELAVAAGAVLVGARQEIEHIVSLYQRIRYAPEPPPITELRAAIRAFQPNG
ncbi:MAG: DUF3488 domain-containing protein [Xanthomonadales bacterium]|nr:DUF3488 domain-containing protein [Xanthomonadales bacterium]NIN58650.1 DUF3488 domain-containing protein [Xanthomonadales bacterium]NIN73945.1 DUF3488 domain-containing protein [Xanthomonadales bacterium]NIO14577.1 DUF3488 domain-containing protein [Xanthomonadales bacterium]NIP11043.1 DUF3488 domain-containing protein [Xanthomonadales bacterium]